MKKRRSRKYKKIIIIFVTMLFVSLVAAVGLYKTGIYRFDFLKDVLKKVDFQMNLIFRRTRFRFLFMILSKKNIYYTRAIASCPPSQVWQNYLPLIMLWEK